MMDVKSIPLSEINADFDFNCRGVVTPADVAEDLIPSIRDHGLQQPILVMPYTDEEAERLKKKYLLVAGYRRLIACKALGLTEIPCVINSKIDKHKAQVLNLVENLDRKDLNIMQEARAIDKWKIAGFTQEQIAKEIGKSRSWVQVRFMVLDFDPHIQKAIEEGYLGQNQIRLIYGLPLAQRHEAVRKIKDQRLKGDREIKITKPVSANSKRARDKTEINGMLDHIIDNLGVSFTTRALAWAAGNISSMDLYIDIRTQMNELGKEYEIPTEELA